MYVNGQSIDPAKLNRKQRRLLEFGSYEDKQKVLQDLKDKEPLKVITEKDGLILVPKTPDPSDRYWSIAEYMLPREMIPDECKAADGYQHGQPCEGSTPDDFRRFVSTWFHKGLKSAEYTFKPTVVFLNSEIPKEKAFLQYVGMVLSSWENEHMHKMYYATYIVYMCCSHVKWEVSE